MALKEEFERSGNWLFRRRSYLPLLLAAILVPALGRYCGADGACIPGPPWDIFCLAVSLAGLGVRILAIGYAARDTSGRNVLGQEAEALNTTGLYSVVRHPLYLGNYLMWLGVSLFPRAWWAPVIVSLIFWIYYERIMFAEEEFLRGRYGTTFEEWAGRTPAFIPRFSRWEPPEAPSFWWRRVLRTEFSGLFGTAVSFALLDAIRFWLLHGRPGMEPLWLAVFGVGAVIYVVLVALKKLTRLLKG